MGYESILPNKNDGAALNTESATEYGAHENVRLALATFANRPIENIRQEQLDVNDDQQKTRFFEKSRVQMTN